MENKHSTKQSMGQMEFKQEIRDYFKTNENGTTNSKIYMEPQRTLKSLRDPEKEQSVEG